MTRLGLPLFLLAGCDLPQMAEEWQLDRLRLLAIAAEPAEPVPGDKVTFTSLQFVPDSDGAPAEWSSAWFACVDGDEEGCTLDPALVDQLEHADQLTQTELLALLDQLRAAGFVGVQPGMDLEWDVPLDALDGLSDAEALEGRSATVDVSLATADDNELVLKRIPVSRATTPNHNPGVAPIEIDGNAVDPSVSLALDSGNNYDVHAALSGDPETYTYVTTAGATESRTEKPSWRWYTSCGVLTYPADTGIALSFEDSGEIESSMVWTTPSEPGTCVLDAVVLDGRGGMGWQSISASVR